MSELLGVNEYPSFIKTPDMRATWDRICFRVGLTESRPPAEDMFLFIEKLASSGSGRARDFLRKWSYEKEYKETSIMPKTAEEFYGLAYTHAKDTKLLDKAFRQMCLAYISGIEIIQARAVVLAAKTELEAFAA